MLYWRGVAGRFARPLELPPVLSPLFADLPRYAAYALTLAGPRKRMLKLPLALLDRVLPLGLATRAMELWGWALRARGRP
ncbi:MAG: hypothetical protein WCG26_07590 [Chloroflexales bacterium]